MSLKQRLIGAAVLIALAVIFVPMLLDGAGQRETQVSENMDIPPEPKVTFEEDLGQSDSAREPGAGEQAGGAQPAGEAQSADKTAGQGAQRPSEPEVASAESPERVEPAPAEPPGNEAGETTPEASEQASETRVEPSDVAKRESAPGSSAADEASPQSAPDAWVVQVGSFSERDNAAGLRDRLKAAEFAAFIEEGQAGGAPVFRVRIGPQPEREEAETLLARLKREESLNGIVVSHP